MKTFKIFIFLVLAFFAINVSSVSADEVTKDVTVTVISPDIVCDPTSAPSSSISATAGVAKTLTSTCRNWGSASTGGTSFPVIMITATASGGGGTRTTVSAGSLSNLAASTGTGNVSAVVTFPSAGTYSYTTCGDQTYKGETPGVIDEGANEGNNCSWWTDIVVPADPVITFNGNGNTGGSTASQTISANGTANLTANGFTKTGYSFNGWNTNSNGTGTSYVDRASYTIGSSNVTLYAQWSATPYYVYYMGNGSNGGSTTSSGPYYINDTGTLRSNGFTRTGYSFNGWNTNSSGTGTNYAEGAGFTVGSSDIYMYAKWTVNPYTITFDGNSNDGGSTASQSINYGSTAALRANGFTKTNHWFTGWNTASNGSGTSYSNGANYTMSSASNRTLYAQWQINGYIISFNGNGNTGGSTASQVITSGGTASLRANGFTRTGYMFTGWATSSGGSAVYSDGSSYTMGSSDVTLYATWTINKYTITASSGSNGTVTPSGVTTKDYNTSQVYSITPDTGYHIVSVLVDGVSQGAISTYTFSNISASHTISATFAINTYNIVASSTGSGTITPSGTTTKNYGTSQAYTITPSANYHIVSVLVDGVSQGSINSYNFSNITSSHTISVTFAIDAFTITASSGGNGTVSPAGVTTKDYGTSQAYTITPSANYHIVSVLVDGVSQGAISTYTFSNISASHTISATFALDTYTLTVARNGNGTGSVNSNIAGISCGSDCSETYNYGTSVVLTASSSLDSSFSGWSGGGCSGTGTCTVTVDSSKTVTATFTKIPVITSLTVSPDPVEFGTSTDISFTSQYAAYCVMLLDFNMSPTLWEGASGSHTANTGNLTVEGSHMASVSCMNSDGVDSGLINVSFTVSPDDIAPTILPITAIGADKLYATWNLQFNIEGNDADIGDTIHYVVDWMDGSPNTTTPTVVISSSGLPGYTRMTVGHMWNTAGPKTFRARTVDLKGKTSAWEEFTFTAKLLPPLPTIDSLVSNKPLNQIEYNDTVNLAWTSTGADSCSMATNFSPGVNVISNFSDAQSLDNNKDFVPPQKTIYSLTCRNDAGEAKKSITIIVGKLDPTITEF